jgi:hypothetical protein
MMPIPIIHSEPRLMAFQTPITVKEAIANIYAKKYLLPAIQREVVWDTAQIERLFDSLMRDYPIGSFLFWMVKRKQTGNYQFYEFVRDYHEKDNPHNAKANVSGQADIVKTRVATFYLISSFSRTKRLTNQRKMFIGLGLATFLISRVSFRSTTT